MTDAVGKGGIASTGEPVRLWGGAFASGPSAELAALSKSVHFDWRLAPYDLLSSIAHARVLHRAGLLNDDELKAMVAALESMIEEVKTSQLQPAPADEDVHTALERILVERLGRLGGKLRAGRSRNDQIATDLRLYLRDEARRLTEQMTDLQASILEQADRHVETAAPGFTHLQRAQPVSFAHELLKHVHALARDLDRIRDWDRRTAFSPLGAGALAGSSLPLDPRASARELGFEDAIPNSIDAVSDRDFAAEFAFDLALMGTHLARLGEEVVLWTSREFGWATLSDAYATGSSIMPQKRNPDVAELARGKSARLIGNLTTILALLKALPFAYNRDLQEDKEPVFDSVDTLHVLLPALSGLVATLTFDVVRMRAAAPSGHALATDVAEWLVRQGVPFREAHEIAGQCVRRCDEKGVELWDLSPEELADISSHLTPDVREVLSLEGALASRSSFGGTAPARVQEQLEAARDAVADAAAWAAVGS